MMNAVIASALFFCFTLGGWAYGAEAPVVLVSGASVLERHAADEFAKYARIIAGKELRRSPAASKSGSGTVVSVGRNPFSELLAQQGLLEVPANGDEAILIRSIGYEGRKFLVLWGSSPKATLYAVYRYLESVCHVGFFGDGEHVPKLKALPVDGIKISESPRYPVREYMMDCEYSSYWWNWDQWKAEVDWAAKHRFNVLSSNFDFTATWRAVWKRFGVNVPPAMSSSPKTASP